MSKGNVRINLQAYDHRILDSAAKKIVETVTRSGGEISGPVPLPTNPSKETIDALTHLDLPSGVDIKIKVEQ